MIIATVTYGIIAKVVLGTLLLTVAYSMGWFASKAHTRALQETP